MKLDALFPDFVSVSCVRYALGERSRFDGVELPRALDGAALARKLDFRAGRWCAREALRGLSHPQSSAPVAIGADHGPAWPPDIVGAITHTAGFAAAAVARATDALGVGVDAERIVSRDMFASLRAHVATREEMEALARAAALDDAVLHTLVFSAKESAFKCLCPRVGRTFDFADVVVVDVGPSSWTAELRKELVNLPCGTRLDGTFAVDGDLVHSGLILPARS